jgi:hypothetical protein
VLIADACQEIAKGRRVDDAEALVAGAKARPEIGQDDVVALLLPEIHGTEVVAGRQVDTGEAEFMRFCHGDPSLILTARTSHVIVGLPNAGDHQKCPKLVRHETERSLYSLNPG